MSRLPVSSPGNLGHPGPGGLRCSTGRTDDAAQQEYHETLAYYVSSKVTELIIIAVMTASVCTAMGFSSVLFLLKETFIVPRATNTTPTLPNTYALNLPRTLGA